MNMIYLAISVLGILAFAYLCWSICRIASAYDKVIAETIDADFAEVDARCVTLSRGGNVDRIV